MAFMSFYLKFFRGIGTISYMKNKKAHLER